MSDIYFRWGLFQTSDMYFRRLICISDFWYHIRKVKLRLLTSILHFWLKWHPITYSSCMIKYLYRTLNKIQIFMHALHVYIAVYVIYPMHKQCIVTCACMHGTHLMHSNLHACMHNLYMWYIRLHACLCMASLDNILNFNCQIYLEIYTFI